MTSINLNLTSYEEPTTVPDGQYQLAITSAEFKEDKNGKGGLMIRMEIPAEPLAADVSTWLSLPDAQDDEKTRNRKGLQLKRFCTCFGVPLEGTIEAQDLVGMTGWVVLGTKDDPQYGRQHVIKSYLPQQ